MEAKTIFGVKEGKETLQEEKRTFWVFKLLLRIFLILSLLLQYRISYLCFGGLNRKYMQIIRVTAYSQPVTFCAERQRIDGGVFVASSDLLDELAVPGVEYSHLDTFL